MAHKAKPKRNQFEEWYRVRHGGTVIYLSIVVAIFFIAIVIAAVQGATGGVSDKAPATEISAQLMSLAAITLVVWVPVKLIATMGWVFRYRSMHTRYQKDLAAQPGADIQAQRASLQAALAGQPQPDYVDCRFAFGTVTLWQIMTGSKALNGTSIVAAHLDNWYNPNRSGWGAVYALLLSPFYHRREDLYEQFRTRDDSDSDSDNDGGGFGGGGASSGW